MKKFVLFFIMLISVSSSVFAYSSGFGYMLNAMGIATVNCNGLTINEEIYNRYNLIVYGSPQNVTHNQRYKETENGSWSNNFQIWNGNGARGEYWILGQDYLGKPVHNEIFPDDFTSGTSPLFWNYRQVKDAEESWSDASKFQYEIQRKYMLNSKLSRFGITYDLTAKDIGLDKARVENYATWGNAGSIYTEKPGEGNVYWAATFSVPPLAKDAKLNSVLETNHGFEYTINKNQESIDIPILFGSEIFGVSEYASEDHIRIIEAELKINGISTDFVNAVQQLEINKEHILTINKLDYPKQNKIFIEVECNSVAATYFSNDPPMYDSKKITIVVNIENDEYSKVKVKNEKAAPDIYKIEVKRVTTINGKEGLVDLYFSKRTKTNFICAGQVIKIKVITSTDASNVSFDFDGYKSIKTLDDLTLKFEWTDPKARGERARFSSLKELQNAYKFSKRMMLVKKTESTNVFEATYVIPYSTNQSLHSWNSLREISGSAFDIDESKLFTRKDREYKLVVKASNARKTSTESYLFDVAERWDELYNRDLTKYVKVGE